MHILVIEDDVEMQAYLARGLREQGHLIDTADNGPDGLHLASEGRYDLFIVDRLLPGLDGLVLLKALRAKGISTPALFLTALATVADRVEGLEAGGDDYLIKPFSFMELNARVNALLRRPPIQEATTLYQVGDLQLDRLSRQVTRAGTPVELQPREYQLLEYLMQHAGRVITRTMLLEEIWGFHFDPGSNIVESHISRIRAKIECPGARSLIHTVRGAGYMLHADQ